MCLLFLSVLVASGQYLTISSLIVICIYLLLRCLLSDMSSSLFSIVIMLSPLISRIPIYIFLLLCIIIIFVIGLAQYFISVESFTFWDGHSPRVFSVLTKPILFLFHDKGFHIVIYLGDILVLVALSGHVRGLGHFCILYWFALDYVLIFPSLTSTSLRHFVLWVYVGILSIVSIFASW